MRFHPKTVCRLENCSVSPECRHSVDTPTMRHACERDAVMLKPNALFFVLSFLVFPVHAENWRYCAANAPLNTPCKAWVSAYLAGHAPEVDHQEVPRYMSDTALSQTLNPVSKADVPSFGTPMNHAAQPFAKVSLSVIVR